MDLHAERLEERSLLAADLGIDPLAATGFFLQSKPGDDTVPTGVTNLYWNLLGRGPDTAGEQGWLAYGEAHQNVLGDQVIVSGFLNSPEYKAHYVTSLYEDFLGRAPEAGGLAFWTDKMGNPGTPGQHGGSADEKYVLAAILGSTEYYNDAGGTAQGWINALYGDLLGRAPGGGDMPFWENELAVRGPGDRDGIVRDILSAPETAHDLLDVFYPAPGGTTANPLPTPGNPAGTGGDKLALISGGGWENLYLDGAYGNAQEGNDAFFAALAGGASWDDVQYLMLTSQQYYSNGNNPVTSSAAAATYQGDFAFGNASGAVTFTVSQQSGSAVTGEVNFAGLGTGTFTGTTSGNNAITGTISGISNGPTQFTVTLNPTTSALTGTVSGMVNGQTVNGNITGAQTTTYQGNFTFGSSSGTAAFAVNQQTASAISGQATFSNLGTGAFTGTANGTNSYSGTISGIANGPSQFNVAFDPGTQSISGTVAGTVAGQPVTGNIGTNKSSPIFGTWIGTWQDLLGASGAFEVTINSTGGTYAASGYLAGQGKLVLASGEEPLAPGSSGARFNLVGPLQFTVPPGEPGAGSVEDLSNSGFQANIDGPGSITGDIGGTRFDATSAR